MRIKPMTILLPIAAGLLLSLPTARGQGREGGFPQGIPLGRVAGVPEGLPAFGASLAGWPAESFSWQDDNPSRQLYDRARRDLEERRYQEAAAQFEQVAQFGDYRPDGALYWKAYALSRMGQSVEALETLSGFYSSYPESRWASEARLLEAEIQQAGGNPVQPGSDADEEMKLAILSGLAHNRSPQAIEMMQKILQGNYALKLKERALFALSQNSSPQAAEIIAGVAKGDALPDLQLKALRYLGLFGGQRSRQLLDEIYSASSDAEIKRAIIGSWMHSGSRERLAEIARQEEDARLRSAAVQQLGILGARQELSQLYSQEEDQDIRRGILNALAISGAVDELAGLARSESDPELRRAAVSKLGLVNRQDAAPVLQEIYSQDSDPSVKRAVLTAYFLQRNDQALIEIVRREADPGLRKAAVQKLSLLGTPAATQFLLELLEK